MRFFQQKMKKSEVVMMIKKGEEIFLNGGDNEGKGCSSSMESKAQSGSAAVALALLGTAVSAEV